MQTCTQYTLGKCSDGTINTITICINNLTNNRKFNCGTRLLVLLQWQL